MGIMNKESYEEMIENDINWLLKNTNHSIERNHIIQVLKHSTGCYYGTDDEILNHITKKWD